MPNTTQYIIGNKSVNIKVEKNLTMLVKGGISLYTLKFITIYNLI
jgi:hypothetical protein